MREYYVAHVEREKTYEVREKMGRYYSQDDPVLFATHFEHHADQEATMHREKEKKFSARATRTV